jgi:8-oxo-dGTP diphosphatase
MTEKEFLDNYNPNEFDKPSVTTDIVVFSVSEEEKENYRKLTSKKLSVLLVKRDTHPFKDKWCLPGGFLRMDETTDEAAIRVLETETNMKNIYLEQLYTFSDIKRDPRMRVLSTAYVALIDKNKYEKVKESASWFELNGDTLSNDQEAINKKDLAFDHDKLITYGLNRIKNKIEYTDIVFNLMPEHFTLGELQQVYEVILGKKLLDPAFRRIIANKVVKTNKVKTGGGHRPSVLYKEKKK